MEGAIVCRDLVKEYRARRALDGVSFAVAPGEIVALLGPNGAGKSTALSIFATLLDPTAGAVEVAGHALPGAARRARASLGLVPQRLALYPTLTARENLAYFAALHGLARAAARAAIAEILARVGLDGRADEPVASYSGGMARRLNLACGILHHPSVVLLDEPTVGVDPQARERIYDLERTLAAGGAAILHSTHLMEEAEHLADRVVLLDHGRVLAAGTPAELIARSGLRPWLALRTARPLPADWSPGVAGAVRRAAAADAEVAPRVVVDLETTSPLAEVLAAARAAGGEIVDVSLHQPNLADVFFLHTGRALRDESNGSGG